jgi:hypothetical protein
MATSAFVVSGLLGDDSIVVREALGAQGPSPMMHSIVSTLRVVLGRPVDSEPLAVLEPRLPVRSRPRIDLARD